MSALARYLTHLRTTTAYFDAKDNVRSFLDGVPLVGAPLKNHPECKTLVRRAMYHSTMFEDMGFQYIGPVDGHNVEELERTLRTIRKRPGPHFPACRHQKGQGLSAGRVEPRQLSTAFRPLIRTECPTRRWLPRNRSRRYLAMRCDRRRRKSRQSAPSLPP